MNGSSANIMVALIEDVVCVRITGRANFTLSLDLKKLINELLGRGFKRFIFDLSGCQMMDSTFLGVLAGLGLKFAEGAKRNGQQLELFNPNPRIYEVLENLGVLHLFRITTDTQPGPAAEHFEALPAQQATRTEVTRTCLEAHQTLMKINPDNVHKFKDVTQFLAEDLKRLEAAEKK